MFQPEFITYSDNLEYPKIPLRSFFQFIFTTNKDQDLDHLRGVLKTAVISLQKRTKPHLYVKNGVLMECRHNNMQNQWFLIILLNFF